jgi:ABC-type uncharacterized transport system permease subunit
MGIKQTALSVLGRNKEWIFRASLWVVFLFLVFPLRNEELKSSSAFWAGLIERLSDGRFVFRAMMSGVLVALTAFGGLLLVNYIVKLTDPPPRDADFRDSNRNN